MADLKRTFRHLFAGGLATDFGSHADVTVEADGRVRIPFLLRAENVRYTLNGGVAKRGGTTKYNSSAIESGEEIRGMFEYVRIGTGGTTTRKMVVHAGTKILKDDNDGTFASIATGLEDDKVPNYNVFEDQLIIASDSTVDVPKTWDQTTFANLGGSPPNFSFSVNHANRVWAAGDAAAPSRLYYSSLLEAAEWNGAGNSGSIDIDPSDGDIITGIYPFRNELIVFKGPNFGSIHRISGLTPSTFARDVLIRGIGAVWQNSIFMFGSDLGFVWSDGTVRTLLASERFGDFEMGTLSRPINRLILERVNTAHLRKAWAAQDTLRGEVYFTLPFDASTKPNLTLAMDYRFLQSEPFPRWSVLTAFGGWSVIERSNPSNSNRHEVYIGGNDGFIRRLNGSNYNIDGGSTAISAYVRLPFIHYGLPSKMKTLHTVGLGLSPKGSYSSTFAWRRDSAAEQTTTISQHGDDVLGPGSVDVFTLDSSDLSDDAYRTRWSEPVSAGQFRDISYEFRDTTVDQALECHSVVAVVESSVVESFEN